MLESESELLVLLPVKEPSLAKLRMKSQVSPEFHRRIEILVEKTFFNTMLTVKKLGLNFGVISPSKKILVRSKELGAIFISRDSGTDLNDALEKAIEDLESQVRWKAVLILMADLPLLTQEELKRFLNKCLEANSIGILAAWKHGSIEGTCGLYLPLPANTELFFGKKSYECFKNHFIHQKLKFIELATSPRLSCWDLDTVNDLVQMRDLVMVEPVKQAMVDLLATIDHEKMEKSFLSQAT
ncbi:MAG: hypothetical protein ACFFD4_23430 [Candidatus Odinarchaeota archaeon]